MSAPGQQGCLADHQRLSCALSAYSCVSSAATWDAKAQSRRTWIWGSQRGLAGQGRAKGRLQGMACPLQLARKAPGLRRSILHCLQKAPD